LTLPAGTTYRFGADPATCPAGSTCGWLPAVTVTTQTSIIPYYNSFPSDPAYGVVKEFDVLETSAQQLITVDGSAITVPALSAQMPNAFKICSACTITEVLMAESLHLQTGTAAAWDQSFKFDQLPASTTTDICGQQTAMPFVVTYTDAAGAHHTITIPVLGLI
jgi:hypothetical protein